MSAQIQGFKINSNIVSLDFNGSYTHFVAGGQESIKIFNLNTQDKCWFEARKGISKYRGTNITKTCVKDLSWNKNGNDLFAIGTTFGYVLVYDANNYSSAFQNKGHDGIVYNVEWNTNSIKDFVSASFDNYILQWDMKASRKEAVMRYEFMENTHIREVKFSSFNPFYLAAQSSTKLQIIDIRKPGKPFWSYEINDSQLNGNRVEWDPKNHNRIASAISKKILIFDMEGKSTPIDHLSHYSLIKSFHWMRNKENHFGILGESPEKNIFVYDLLDKNRIAYMYGGHNRSVDCWRMNGDETLLLSASNSKEKAKGGAGAATTVGHLVAQYAENYFDPNEGKFNYPLTFDKNNALAFCLNEEEVQKKSFGTGHSGIHSGFGRKPSGRAKQDNPMVMGLSEYLGSEVTFDISFPSIRDELIYLYQNYMIDGKSEDVVEHNVRVALNVGKSVCAEFWRALFILAFPLEAEEHTIQSIYEERQQLEIEIIDNRVTLFNRDQLMRETKKISVLDMIQDLVDDNQLQTAVIGTLALIHKQPDLIPFDFLNKLSQPYIALLHNFHLYSIANDTIFMTRDKTILDSTSKTTSFSISCGWCKESMSKGRCKCTLLCVICKESLGERMVMWCKYCGHGGHAVEYRKWFSQEKKAYCPHGCGHACFTPDDFQ